jgi:superfamily II DNA/RNA helicase
VAELVYHLGEAMGQRPKVAVLTGGVSINPQLMALRGGVDWVIATPGRLLDVVEHSRLQLNRIHTLVLDEADRLMDLGFAEELDRVLALLPATGQRQTLLLSATFPPAVEAIAAACCRTRPPAWKLPPPTSRTPPSCSGPRMWTRPAAPAAARSAAGTSGACWCLWPAATAPSMWHSSSRPMGLRPAPSTAN